MRERRMLLLVALFFLVSGRRAGLREAAKYSSLNISNQPLQSEPAITYDRRSGADI